MKAKLVIVGGAERSGTFLVQRAISAQPHVFGGNQCDFLETVALLWRKMRDECDTGFTQMWNSGAKIDEIARNYIEDFFSNVDTDEIHFISEKTPHNCLAFKELAYLLPEAHFVMCIRDPRAIVASLLKVGEKLRKSGKTPPVWTRSTKHAVNYISKCWSKADLDQWDKNNLSIIQYEDVVNETGEINKLFEEIGVSADKASIAADLENNGMEMPSDFGRMEGYYTEKELSRPLDNQSLNKWKKSLSRWQVRYINSMVSGPDVIMRRYTECNAKPSRITNVFATIECWYRNFQLRLNNNH